jgi:hypothetical protein
MIPIILRGSTTANNRLRNSIHYTMGYTPEKQDFLFIFLCCFLIVIYSAILTGRPANLPLWQKKGTAPGFTLERPFTSTTTRNIK